MTITLTRQASATYRYDPAGNRLAATLARVHSASTCDEVDLPAAAGGGIAYTNDTSGHSPGRRNATISRVLA